MMLFVHDDSFTIDAQDYAKQYSRKRFQTHNQILDDNLDFIICV